jgi:hypothetical protein
MFDNLREASTGGDPYAGSGSGLPAPRRTPARRIFGMTAGQRFLISLLLLLTVIVMGVMCLLVTGRVFL